MRTIRVPSLTVLLALGAGRLLAAGFSMPAQDAKVLARGNAFVATVDNPSAIALNPAGITQLPGHQTRSGLMLVYAESSYRSPSGQETDSIHRVRGLAQFFYSYTPEKLPLSFGLGIYPPFGLGSDWPDDSPFRTLATKSDLIYLSFNPVAAWKINQALSIGVGPTLNWARADWRRGLMVPGDQFRFRGDGFGPGFNAGLLWRPHERHAFGVGYTSATTAEFRGHASVRNLTPGIPGLPASGKEESSLEFPFPQTLTVGWSFRPTPSWNLEFDTAWMDYARLGTVTLERLSGAVPLTFSWRPILAYRCGATHYFKNGYTFSGGYSLVGNAAPDATFNPAVADVDLHIFSVGVGHQGEKWSWDAAYSFMYGPPRTVTGSAKSPIGQSADGRYETDSGWLALSLGFRF